MSEGRPHALHPAEQKTIIFYDDELTAVRLDDGSVYVPVRRPAENPGSTWPSQRNPITRDEILAKAFRPVFIMDTDLKANLLRVNQKCSACLWTSFQAGFSASKSAGSKKKSGQTATIPARVLPNVVKYVQARNCPSRHAMADRIVTTIDSHKAALCRQHWQRPGTM